MSCKCGGCFRTQKRRNDPKKRAATLTQPRHPLPTLFATPASVSFSMLPPVQANVFRNSYGRWGRAAASESWGERQGNRVARSGSTHLHEPALGAAVCRRLHTTQAHAHSPHGPSAASQPQNYMQGRFHCIGESPAQTQTEGGVPQERGARGEPEGPNRHRTDMTTDHNLHTCAHSPYPFSSGPGPAGAARSRTPRPHTVHRPSWPTGGPRKGDPEARGGL